MKFSCSRAKLSEALSLIADVLPARAAKAVLQNVQLTGNADGTITLAATDLEIGLRYTLEVENLADAGTALLPGARLIGLVRDDWAETAHLAIEGDRAELRTENGTFHLVGGAGEDFPQIKQLEEKDAVEINGSDFAEAVRKTAFATARDETRFALNGILLSIDKGTAEFVASDTHRLSLVRKKVRNKGGAKTEAIIITKGMSTLAKLAESQETVRLQLTPHELIAQTANATLVTRLVDGQFPRYRDVIPKDLENKVTIARDMMMNTLRLVGQMTNEETRSVTLSSGDGKLLVSATGSEAGDGQVEIPAETEGKDELAISFSYIYVVDALRVLDTDKVTLLFRDSDSPARLDVDDFTHVIMPIRSRG